MSIDLDLFCFIVPLMIPSAVLLSVIILVAGCGCPISMRLLVGGIISPNDNGENLIEYIVLCKQSTIISY
jgi:hypothetical protein